MRELDRLVAAVAFTVLIGNADAHGKNLALLHVDGGSVELAPLYDLVPTVLWPRLRRTPAMAIGPRVTTIDRTGVTDVVGEAAGWGHAATRARSVVRDLAERALAAVVDEDVIEHEQVAELVAANARRLLAG